MKISVEIVEPSVKLLAPFNLFDFFISYPFNLFERITDEEKDKITFQLTISRLSSYQLLKQCPYSIIKEPQYSHRRSKNNCENCIKVICPPSIAVLKEGTVFETEYNSNFLGTHKIDTGNYILDSWLSAIFMSYGSYLVLTNSSREISLEDAAFVLTNSIKTEMVITANVKQYRQLFKLLYSKNLQWEISKVMKQCLLELVKSNPNEFGDEEMEGILNG